MRIVTQLPSINIEEPTDLVVAHAKQDDRLTRWFSAPVLQGTDPWEPPTNGTATIRFMKADGHGGWYDRLENGSLAVEVSGSTVIFGLASQAISYAGRAVVAIEWFQANGERISGFNLYVDVEADPNPDHDIVSTDYYNVLSIQIASVLNAAENLTGLTASATALASMATPTATVTGGTESEPYNIALGIPGGPYFTPSVSTDGDISWTNNGNLSNPATRNIKGPQGVSITSTTKKSGTGAPGTTDVYGVNLSNGTEAGTFNVYNGQDGQGSPGSATPLSDSGNGVVGTATAYSREDHRHPYVQDTSLQPIHFTSTLDSLPKTISDSRITAGMRVFNPVFATPAALTSDLSWTTAAGSIVFSGALSTQTGSDSTVIDFDLVECRA